MKKRMTLILMALLMLCAAIVPVSSARALELSTGVINADGVALRKTASADSGVVTRLKQGTVVKILESNVKGEWYRVETGTRTGYVNRLYVDIDASLPSYQLKYTGTIYNVQQDVNVRAEPSLKGKKLGKANKGQTFEVTQAFASGEWHKIDFNGAVGYVNANYLQLAAIVGNDLLRDIEVTGGTLSPAFSPTEYGYVLTATQGEVDIKAIANDGVKVSIGNTGIATAKYTIKSGNSKTIRISVKGVVKYSIYLVRDVLTVGTWNIKRGNDNLEMQGWLIAAQKPDILGIQEVYINEKENKSNLLSVRTKNAQYMSFAETIKYPSGGKYGIGQISKFKPENPTITPLSSEDKEPRCLQKVEYVVNDKRVSVYNTHFSYESDTIRKKQFSEVIKVMNADKNEYKILTGDFNAKESEFSGFLRNYRVVNTSATKFYNYSYKVIGMSQIDNIVVSKNITVLNARAIPTEYSDHYPLFAFLALK
jgi:uncharacterized protein YgiM (DUF1202 family)/endonuclease/exonuclease/phosphatase family metal-dependent hydrolase